MGDNILGKLMQEAEETQDEVLFNKVEVLFNKAEEILQTALLEKPRIFTLNEIFNRDVFDSNPPSSSSYPDLGYADTIGNYLFKKKNHVLLEGPIFSGKTSEVKKALLPYRNNPSIKITEYNGNEISSFSELNQIFQKHSQSLERKTSILFFDDLHELELELQQKVRGYIKTLSQKSKDKLLVLTRVPNLAKQVNLKDDKKIIKSLALSKASDSDMGEMFRLGEEKLNIHFDSEWKEEVKKISNGNLGIVQALSHYSISAEGVKNTQSSQVNVPFRQISWEPFKRELADSFEEFITILVRFGDSHDDSVILFFKEMVKTEIPLSMIKYLTELLKKHERREGLAVHNLFNKDKKTLFQIFRENPGLEKILCYKDGSLDIRDPRFRTYLQLLTIEEMRTLGEKFIL